MDEFGKSRELRQRKHKNPEHSLCAVQRRRACKAR